jgi:hypothetical protein
MASDLAVDRAPDKTNRGQARSYEAFIHAHLYFVGAAEGCEQGVSDTSRFAAFSSSYRKSFHPIYHHHSWSPTSTVPRIPPRLKETKTC